MSPPRATGSRGASAELLGASRATLPASRRLMEQRPAQQQLEHQEQQQQEEEQEQPQQPEHHEQQQQQEEEQEQPQQQEQLEQQERQHQEEEQQQGQQHREEEWPQPELPQPEQPQAEQRQEDEQPQVELPQPGQQQEESPASAKEGSARGHEAEFFFIGTQALEATTNLQEGSGDAPQPSTMSLRWPVGEATLARRGCNSDALSNTMSLLWPAEEGPPTLGPPRRCYDRDSPRESLEVLRQAVVPEDNEDSESDGANAAEEEDAADGSKPDFFQTFDITIATLLPDAAERLFDELRAASDKTDGFAPIEEVPSPDSTMRTASVGSVPLERSAGPQETCSQDELSAACSMPRGAEEARFDQVVASAGPGKLDDHQLHGAGASKTLRIGHREAARGPLRHDRGPMLHGVAIMQARSVHPQCLRFAAPVGARPRDTVHIAGPTGPLAVQLPEDTSPGWPIEVHLGPPESWAVEVTVPEGAATGTELTTAGPGGMRITVRVPPQLKEGNKFLAYPRVAMVELPPGSQPGTMLVSQVPEGGQHFQVVVPPFECWVLGTYFPVAIPQSRLCL